MIKHYMTFLLGIATIFWMGTLYAGQDYQPGVLLIKTKPSFGAMGTQSSASTETFNQKMGALNTRALPIPRSGPGFKATSAQTSWFIVTFSPTSDIKALAQTYEQEQWIDAAEPNYWVYASSEPTDPLYGHQTYITQSDLKALYEISASHDVIVGILDSGIDYTHADLLDAIYHNTADPVNGIDDDGNGLIDDEMGYNFYQFSLGAGNANPMDIFGHGTHIAGIIGATAGNHKGIAGLNPKAKLLNVAFINRNGIGTQSDAAFAVRYAVDQGARILNCSWGYSSYNTILREAIEYAIEKGAIIIAAGGNSNTSDPEYPAGFDQVWGVASINTDYTRSTFSNWGNHILFSEFGKTIYSTIPNGYGYKSGTSQSAAVLSGIVSKILSYNPNLTRDQIQTILRQSSSLASKDNDLGYGYIKASSLAESLGEPTSNPTTSLPNPGITTSELTLNSVLNFPNPFGLSGTQFGFESNGSADVTIKVFNLNGQLQKQLQMTAATGYNTVSWNGKGDLGQTLANGTYLYLLTAKGTEKTILKKGKLTIYY